MRIRKNAKLSPLLFTCSSSLLENGSVPVETFQTHICHLNQSPWDVIPFHSNNSIQFDDEHDAFKNNHSFEAFQSVVSMMDTEEVDDNNKPAIENFSMMMIDDNQRGKKVVDKAALRRISSCKEMYNGGSIVGTPVRRGRGRPKKSSGSGSGSNNNNINNNEYYYYSGFGPLWRKRRSDKNGEENDNSSGGGVTIEGGGENSNNNNNNNNSSNNVVGVDVNVVPCCLEMDIEGLDYVNNDDEEEDDYDDYGDDNGKRRMRKPVKERSLKSLM